MLLSLFTPTHKPTYLLEAYHSLKLQTLAEWEWVILPNGEDAEIPAVIRADSRVKIISGHGDLYNIGSLKRQAVAAATGDAFIEFDHDDLLVPGDSLQRIRAQFLAGAGFVYSDSAVFRFQAQPVEGEATRYAAYSYSGQHGWQDYPIQVYGRKLLATKCFDVTPRSLAEIYYCPDHVRSWSRKAYYEAGGYNPSLSVCDDHELMIKTYLTNAKFAHTGGCQYLYRMFDQNTVVTRNKQIQATTRTLRESYIQPLIQAWLRRTGFEELNISELRKTGWDPDRYLLQGFGESQYGHIVADTELQRLTGVQVREFMNEAHEALVPGGYLTITVPEVHSGMGYADVEWKSHFSLASMYPYTRRPFAGYNGKIGCRFQQINCLEVYPSSWHKEHGFKFLRFELVALKGQRHPGLQHI